MLLTGPNMAGKSTFLRQNALFVVLAQAGLPVPAESAVSGDRRPAVQPRGRRRRSGARAIDLHGRDDRDRRDSPSGGPAIAGGGGRDRPRHRHAGWPGDRLGGAGSAALRDPLPHHFRHTFP